MLVDRRERIVVGGHRLLEDAADPFNSPTYREDFSSSAGFVARYEGADPRVALTTTRIAPKLTVRCLPLARSRCSGRLTVRRTGRRTLVRTIRLASGAKTRITLPRALRRGARKLHASVRVTDATGALSSATRTLRR